MTIGQATPDKIEKSADEGIRIVWADGHDSYYSARYLRQSCPCAMCRDEMTGRRVLDPETVAADTKALRAELVGRYALTLSFSDGHGTGIFSFELLRELCPCKDCQK
jgi:DUF971 family protein